VGELRIGTSGWSYPQGEGTWNGVFYPDAASRPKGFDELRFYAEHFDTVEVNSTFYGQPRASVTRAWAERTPPGFIFSVKLFQKRRALDTPSGHHEAVRELVRPTAVDIDAFRRGIDPLAAAGKLGAVLAQFPPSFKAADPERAYLQHLLRALSDYPVAVEVRHSTWSDAFTTTLDLLPRGCRSTSRSSASPSRRTGCRT
jgi:uncharacterized protein YecE (DUF72 family)